MQKHKVLFLVHGLTSGGTEKVMVTIANNLNCINFSIDFCVIDGDTINYKLNDDIKLIVLGKKRLSMSVFSLIRLVNNYDLIFSSLTHINIAMSLFKRFIFKKQIFIARESVVLSVNHNFIKNRFLYNYLIKRNYKYLDKIVCQSDDMVSDMLTNYNITKDKLIKITNPIDEKKRQISVFYNKIIFITICRLVPQKGVERIIHGLSRLRNINFEYNIIGYGELLFSLKELVVSLGLQDKVHFLGEANANNILPNSSFYLFGSYVEGFPNSIIESLAYGVPVLGYNCKGGLNEIIINDFNGCLISENSSHDDFASMITASIYKKYNRQAISDDILSRYSMKRIISEYEMFFHDMLNYQC